MPKFIVAYCTYNHAQTLPALANALCQQTCPLPFEILAVHNNSQGNTHALGMIRNKRQRWLENRKK